MNLTLRKLLSEGTEVGKISKMSFPIKSPTKAQASAILALPEDDKLALEERERLAALVTMAKELETAMNGFIDQANTLVGPLREAVEEIETILKPALEAAKKVTIENITFAQLAKTGTENISYKTVVEMTVAKLGEQVRMVVQEIEEELKKTAKAKYEGEYQVFAFRRPAKEATMNEGFIGDAWKKLVGMFRSIKTKFQKIAQDLKLAASVLSEDEQKDLAERLIKLAKRLRPRVKKALS